MNLLSLMTLLLFPLITSIVVGFLTHGEVATRRLSKILALGHLVYASLFLCFINPIDGTYQMVQEVLNDGKIWIDTLGISFSLAIDGISLVLILLTCFLTLLSIIASKNIIKHRHNFYYSMIFLLEFSVLGVFLAKDLFLFFLFWELELIPMYFLISLWGKGRARYSAQKYVLYTFAGSIFMLGAILAIYYSHFLHTGVLSMDMGELSSFNNYPSMLQFFCFLGFLIAFAVKLPIVPLHSWLPDAHVDAPTPISILLAGILLKLGGYGLIKINLFFFPSIFNFFSPILFWFALFNIIYAGLIAYAQSDLKKLVAYSSISNMGFVLVGLCSINSIGTTGAIMHMLSHGLVAASLFMIIEIIYSRTNTREIDKLGGLIEKLPSLYYLSIIFALCAIGIPGLVGFVGEVLCLYGAGISDAFFNIQLFTAIALIGLITSAVYMTTILKKIFCGIMIENYDEINPIKPYEWWVLIPLAILIVGIGICPNPLIQIFSIPIDSFFNM